ncbi:MAG: hypothetical protein QM791_16020 [Ferruginibacter sp.]
MTKIFLAVSMIVFFAACSGNSSTPAAEQNESASEEKDTSFFPVTNFLKGQMSEVDSLQVNFLHTITINGKTDSVWEKQAFAKPFLQPFFAEEINEKNRLALFKSSKFQDQTINTVTFTYDPVKPLPDSVNLRHWDLYINPETGKVIKIYMVRQMNDGGKNYTQQLTWKAGESAGINTLLNNPDGSVTLLKEEKLIWRFTDPLNK